MIKKILLLLIMCVYTSQAQCLIVQISMMKAGTHLMITLLEKMTHRRLAFIAADAYATIKKNEQDIISVTPKDFKYLSRLSNRRFWATHCPYVEEYAFILSQPKYQIIYLYRDPRDVVVSLAVYVRDKDKKFWPGAQEISLEELIARLIVGGPSMHQTEHHISARGIREVYQAYIPWMQLNNALNIRFEDLVGPQGGGDAYTQLNTILAIADHINIEIDMYEATLLGETIFGKSAAFNKGQIGSWKEYFTDELKQLFKEHAGQLLIDLGYEQDLNW
jgi:hypothetical protein